MLAEAILENIEILGFVEVEREDPIYWVSFEYIRSNFVLPVLLCSCDLLSKMNWYQCMVPNSEHFTLSKRFSALLAAFLRQAFILQSIIYSHIRQGSL